MLATRETLYLLHEDHQWRKSSPGHPDQSSSGGSSSGSVDVLETLPISCVSSVQLWPQDPRRMDVKLYDEVGGAKAHFFTFYTPPPSQSGKFIVVMVVSWMYCIQRGLKKKSCSFLWSNGLTQKALFRTQRPSEWDRPSVSRFSLVTFPLG